MVIMSRLPSFILPRFLGALFLAIICLSSTANAYTLEGKRWANGTIVFQFSLGHPALALLDGNTSWNAAAAPALAIWNQKMGRVQLSAAMDSTAPVSSGDHVNSIAFSNSVFGQSFGNGTLAVTYYMMLGENMTEADVLFNRAQTFNSYRGALQFGGPGGYATGDIRRVLTHELGHALGLNHSSGDNIMSPITSNRETLSHDDIAGIQSLYGAPALPPPTPTPAPTPLASGTSHLANISTRMKVGLNDDVLIAGFIVKGSQSKRMILRATGPSLAGSVAGTLGNPSLELHDSTGRILAMNDNWQSGQQAAEITATGVAPTSSLEPALVAILPPGSYTAIVRGANRAQGVALVEGYELDMNATRLVNLSTRGRIGVGEDVLIGGLIVRGTVGKRVIVRAIGPSLAGSVAGALANPSLEMYDSSGNQIAANDDWETSAQRSAIIASTVAPSHSNESAIITTLAPGGYTAIVRGVNNGTGVGLVEVYDLEP